MRGDLYDIDDEYPILVMPPENSLCLVDFGSSFEWAEYEFSLFKEGCGTGLGSCYQVALFSKDCFLINPVAYNGHANADKMKVNLLEADRFLILSLKAAPPDVPHPAVDAGDKSHSQSVTHDPHTASPQPAIHEPDSAEKPP